jgi:hypothetical protein
VSVGRESIYHEILLVSKPSEVIFAIVFFIPKLMGRGIEPPAFPFIPRIGLF